MVTSPSAALGRPNSPATKKPTEVPFKGSVSVSSADGEPVGVVRNRTLPPASLDLLLSVTAGACVKPAASVSLILQGDRAQVTYRARPSTLLLICSSMSIN